MALPAHSTGGEPAHIAGTLLDALLGTLRRDLYACDCTTRRVGLPSRSMRVAESWAEAARVQDIRETIASSLGDAHLTSRPAHRSSSETSICLLHSPLSGSAVKSARSPPDLYGLTSRRKRRGSFWMSPRIRRPSVCSRHAFCAKATAIAPTGGQHSWPGRTLDGRRRGRVRQSPDRRIHRKDPSRAEALGDGRHRSP